jgi:hypothetical protein
MSDRSENIGSDRGPGIISTGGVTAGINVQEGIGNQEVGSTTGGAIGSTLNPTNSQVDNFVEEMEELQRAQVDGNMGTGGNVTVDFLADGFAHLSVWQLFSGTSFTGSLSTFGITGAYGTPTFTYADGEWSADLGGGNSMHFYENDSHAIGDRYRAGQLVVVPEPSTIVIAGIGLLVLGWQRLAKRRRAARMSEDAVAAA